MEAFLQRARPRLSIQYVNSIDSMGACWPRCSQPLGTSNHRTTRAGSYHLYCVGTPFTVSVATYQKVADARGQLTNWPPARLLSTDNFNLRILDLTPWSGSPLSYSRGIHCGALWNFAYRFKCNGPSGLSYLGVSNKINRIPPVLSTKYARSWQRHLPIGQPTTALHPGNALLRISGCWQE
jgi:hypothetical protein